MNRARAIAFALAMLLSIAALVLFWRPAWNVDIIPDFGCDPDTPRIAGTIEAGPGWRVGWYGVTCTRTARGWDAHMVSMALVPR